MIRSMCGISVKMDLNKRVAWMQATRGVKNH